MQSKRETHGLIALKVVGWRQVVIMEWMDNAMVTRLLSLSHIGACTDLSVSSLHTPHLADICLHQR